MTAKLRVTPIAGSAVNWDHFLKDIVNLTGHNLTKSADASGLKLSNWARFILALEELRNENIINSIDALQEANAVLCHLYFSFLISGSSSLIFKIRELTDLCMVTSKLEKSKGRVALVSGTLKQWKDAAVELSKTTQTRKVGNIVLGFFSNLGLQYLFADYTRKNLPDGTFLLEYKAR